MKSLKKVIAVCIMLAVLVTLVLPANADAAAKVKISKTKLTIETLQSHTLKVTGITRKTKVTWSSSNKEVAVVAEGGMVTGIKVGKATITAKVGKKKYSCAVTVKQGRSADDEIVVVTPVNSISSNQELKDFIASKNYKQVTRIDDYTATYHMTRGQQREIQDKIKELFKIYLAELPEGYLSVRANSDFTEIDVTVDANAYLEYTIYLGRLCRWGFTYQGFCGAEEKDLKVTFNMYSDLSSEKFDTIVYDNKPKSD